MLLEIEDSLGQILGFQKNILTNKKSFLGYPATKFILAYKK